MLLCLPNRVQVLKSMNTWKLNFLALSSIFAHHFDNSTPLEELFATHLLDLTLHDEAEIWKIVHDLLLNAFDTRWQIYDVLDSLYSLIQLEYYTIVINCGCNLLPALLLLLFSLFIQIAILFKINRSDNISKLLSSLPPTVRPVRSIRSLTGPTTARMTWEGGARRIFADRILGYRLFIFDIQRTDTKLLSDRTLRFLWWITTQ